MIIEISTNLHGVIKSFKDLRKINHNDKKPEHYYIHSIPKLPSWTNKKYKCSGEIVNLFNLTCTCEDFINRSRLFSERDIRKACKHIYYKLRDTKASEYIDKLTFKLLEAGVFHGEQHLFEYNIKNKKVILGFGESEEWVNVYAKNEGNYSRYSFNIKQQRWSNKWSPTNEHLIRIAIEIVNKYYKLAV